jgi:hypothetical protein
MNLGTEIGARTCVGVSFGSRSPSNRQLMNMLKQQHDVQIETVAFGSVVGSRISRDGITRSFLLKVGKSELWVGINEGDSRLVEPYLHTLSVVEP